MSAILAFSKLTRVEGPHKIYLKKLRIHGETLKKELMIGFPTGMQNSVIAIGNVVVQSNINAFGSVAMAGCGSYFKMEGFVFLPITCMCMALTTFVSQNMGAGNVDRVKLRFQCFCDILLQRKVNEIGIVLYDLNSAITVKKDE